MRRSFILFSFIFIGIALFPQTNPVQITSNTVTKQKAVLDSTKTKKLVPKREHKKMIMTLDTLTMSDYMLSIERVNDNLNSISDSSKLGNGVTNIGHRIDFMTKDVKLIRQNIRGHQTGIHLNNKLDDETDLIQDQLNDIYHRVYHAKLHLKKVLADSIFRKLYTDKELRKTFDDKLIQLEWKWNRTDSLTKANVDSLNALKVRNSDNGLELANMVIIMNRRLDRTLPKLFGQEVNNLWEPAKPVTLSKIASRNTISVFTGEKNAIS